MRFVSLLALVLLPVCSALAAAEPAEPRVDLDPMKITAMPVPILKIDDHPILEPRYGAAVVAQDHYLYVIGGSNGDGTRLDTIERIDLTTGRSEAWSRLKVARRHHRAVIIDGKIYVLGGTSGFAGGLTGELGDVAGDDPSIDSMLPPNQISRPPSLSKQSSASTGRHWRIDYESTMEVVDLATGRVDFGPEMPVAKALFGCVVVNDKIMVIGGQKQKGDTLFCTNTTEIYDPATRRWRAGVNMPTARRCVATVVDEFVVVIGGYNGHAPVDTVEIFRPRDQVWLRLPPVAEKISPSASVWLGSYILFFGNQQARTRQFAYDLRTKRLAPYPLPLPDSGFAAALVHEGKLYVVGGGNLRLHDAVNGIQVFVPQPEPSPAAGTLGGK